MPTFRYLRLHTHMSDTTVGVIREYLGDDDYRVERYDPAARCWVMDNGYARYTLLGEPRSEEITEAEANSIIARGVLR